MAFELGVAYLPILPETSKIAPGIRQALVPASEKAGHESGEKFKAGFGSKLKGLATPLAGAFAGAAIGKAIGDSVREASNLSESINAVRVSYGAASKDILNIGKSSAQAFGLSKSEFNGFAVQFQSFSKTVAGADGDVSKTFSSIIGRATDFASVMNLDVAQAAELFQSGLAGETEPLRKYGIDLSAAAVEAYAMANGIGEAGRQLTEQEKVQARYGLLMEKTSKTQGDFANTSDGLANKQRILGAEWKDLKAKAGGALVPALTSVTGAFSDMIPKVQKGVKIAWDYKEVIAVLGGGLIAYKGAMMGAAAYQAIYAAGTAGATAGTWSLSAALSANPIGLVVIALTALVAGLVVAYKNSETFRNIVNSAWAAIKAGLSAAWSYIQPVLAAIGDWLGVVLPKVFTALQFYFQTWWSVAQTIFGAVVWYVQNILAPIFTWLWQNIIRPVFEAIGGAISWTWSHVISPAFDGIKGAVGLVADAFGAARDKIKDVWDKLTGIVEGPINVAKDIIGGFIDLINKIPGVSIPNPFKSSGFGGGGSFGNAGSRDWALSTRGGSGGYASGGWTGPGGKYTPAGLVHADEFVVKKESRRAIERQFPGVLDYMNRTGQIPLHGSYAEGGQVVPGSFKQHKSGYPWATFAGDAPNPIGTPVKAWKDGVIAAVKSLTTSYGKHIRMNHTDGTSSLYAHLSAFTRAQGDRVNKGDVIGKVGSTGNSTGPHLHFEAIGGLFSGSPGLVGSVKSVWDTVEGASGKLAGMVKDFAAKGNVGGFFGDIGGLFSHIGNGVKGHVLDKLFDAGGMAHGTGLMAKNTIAPERVLSDRQTRAFEQMVRHNFGEDAAARLGQVELSERSVRAVGEYMLQAAAIGTDGALAARDRSQANSGAAGRVVR